MESINIDPNEITKFSDLAVHWWDTTGALATLHQINPLRLQWINQYSPLQSKKVIDVGCGGGILTESMNKLGADVMGIDMSAEAIQIAKLHQHESGTQVKYSQKTAEEAAKENPASYDVVTCLEMLEHVPNAQSVIQACSDLVKTNGDVYFSTLNRNLKSYLFSIVGAEYILKLLPKNTHDFAKFIRPSELAEWARQSGLILKNMIGISYNPLTKEFKLTKDVSVNYIVHMKKL